LLGHNENSVGSRYFWVLSLKGIPLAQQLGALPVFKAIHRRKDGREFPVEVSMGCIKLEGEPHPFAIARGITKLHQTTSSLAALTPTSTTSSTRLRTT
jgi:hypothetical protein